MRKAPQIIISLIVLVFVGWGGYWVIGSRATERVLAGWFEDRRAEGGRPIMPRSTPPGFPAASTRRSPT